MSKSGSPSTPTPAPTPTGAATPTSKPTSRFGRGHKALALVPLAVLSAAWTTSLVTAGAEPVLADATIVAPEPVALPDGTSIPTEAVEAPASVSATSGGKSPGIDGDAARVVATASTTGIPAAALAAYQRAETIINSADPDCHLGWQLVAAIGRVESDHGRTGGNTLDGQGVARPGIFGKPLNGRGGTSKISDSDAGRYDSDSRWDRAVGPMQFIPSTWSVVGVDADGDGQRNPQDVDDAALASAVYLCSGKEDLATTAGQRAAVYRYNHSDSYVDLVLSVMNAYLAGEFTSVPNGVTSAGYVVPPISGLPGGSHPGKGKGHGKGQGKGSGSSSSAGSHTPASSGGSSQPSAKPSAKPSAQPSSKPSSKPSTPPPPQVTPKATISLPPLPSTSITPVDQLLSRAQAIIQCGLDGYIDNPLKTDDPFDQCVYAYTHG